MISIKTNNASSPVFPLSYACKTEGTLFILTRKIRGGKYEEGENKEMQMRKEGKDGPTCISRSIFFQKIRFLFSKYIIIPSPKSLIHWSTIKRTNEKLFDIEKRQIIRLDMARWIMSHWKYLRFHFILIFLIFHIIIISYKFSFVISSTFEVPKFNDWNIPRASNRIFSLVVGKTYGEMNLR